MEKVDRLGWAAGVSVRCYGVKVGVRVNDPATLDEVIERLPPGWTSAEGPVDMLYSILNGEVGKSLSGRRGVKHFHLLYGMAARLARSVHLRAVLEIFRQEAQLLVAQLTRTRGKQERSTTPMNTHCSTREAGCTPTTCPCLSTILGARRGTFVPSPLKK